MTEFPPDNLPNLGTLELPVPEDRDAVFESPWQARAFAVTIALYEEDAFEDFQQFQQHFVAEIQADTDDHWGADTEGTYYQHWLSAVEKLVIDTDTVSLEELHGRAVEFQAEDRDASEFVEGDRGHGDSHDHEHSHPH